MRFFNPQDDLVITQRRLPHWAQDGAVVFITWRTHDSIPKAVLDAWRAERNRWLVAHGIDPTVSGWKSRVQDLPVTEMVEYHDRFTTRWHEELDTCHGTCVLRSAEMARFVAESLLHFDGDRYEMLQFVVMPNHVQFLAAFVDRATMLRQFESWKHYTAREINRRLGVSGRFWQSDAFDHLVRHEAQFRRLQEYIEGNPGKAGLRPGEFALWRRDSSRHAPS